MKKTRMLPNFVTAFALACGLFVIFKISMVEPGKCDFHTVKVCVIFLMLAGLADFMDGALARAFKVESDFGVIFDSLADSISWGVAPSIIVLKVLSLEQKNWLSFMVATGAMVYSLCAALRLVRYSVKAKEAQSDEVEAKAFKKHFTGLPSPASAGALVSLALFYLSSFSDYFDFSEQFKAVTLACAMIFLGYLMVSKWKFFSLKSLNFRIKSFQLAFTSILIASFILYGILYYFSLFIFLLAWGYISIAIIFTIIRLIAGKKSKTLEDFEPDESDDGFYSE